jgi:nitroimidazol reductase NimA-like FMN-containing flavoprotein (pyridoxamine 5'-phosphate oxidase superfamily)
MMTAHEDYWLAMSRGARIVDLERDESLRLLAAKKVGRLAFVSDGAPLVMPMNFTLAGERIIFRTLAYGSAAHAVDSTVAFEVDDIDDYLEAGWSVVVTGRAELLSEEELTRLRGDAPATWAEGPRTLFVAIAVEHVSGRQLIPR